MHHDGQSSGKIRAEKSTLFNCLNFENSIVNRFESLLFSNLAGESCRCIASKELDFGEERLLLFQNVRYALKFRLKLPVHQN